MIVHRIEFQESEREMLRQMSLAYSVDKVSESISQLTTLIVLIFGADFVLGKWDEIEAWYTRFRAEGQMGGLYGGGAPGEPSYPGSSGSAYDENAASVVGGIQNLINNILDALFNPLRQAP